MTLGPRWSERDTCKSCRAFAGEPCARFNKTLQERITAPIPCKGRRLMPDPNKPEPARIRGPRLFRPDWSRYLPCEKCGASHGTTCLLLDGSGTPRKKPCNYRRMAKKAKEMA
jgi:hypothetical protein